MSWLRNSLAALMIAGICAVDVVAVGQTPALESEPAVPSEDPANWRLLDSENLLQLTLTHGSVLVELRPDFAPGHVAQIKQIVRNGHYDGLPFHRVIDEFMAQGGEVRAVYPGAPSYGQLEPEFEFRRNPTTTQLASFDVRGVSDMTGYLDGFVVQSQPESLAPLMADASVNSWVVHCEGVASMARADAPNSADTQFFLMRQPQTQLDRNYTAWGRVVSGLDAVRAIRAGPSETDGRLPPEQADRLLRAMIVSDLEPDARPTVYVQRTDGEQFKSRLAQGSETTSSDPCGRWTPSVIVEGPTRD